MSDIKLGNVPSSTLNNTSNLIFADGENVRKESYANLKADMLGNALLDTTVQTPNEAINELVQDLLDTGGYGVVTGGIVAAQSTPNMTIQISACTLRTATGARQVVSANTSLAVTTADTTNPRIDIVYINSSGVISYLQGTAASSPVAPVTPTGGTLLAQINVAANQTTITNLNITDSRKILISIDALNTLLSEKANPSLLINDCFQVWQRGTSITPTTGSNTYTADRWHCATLNNTLTLSKISTGGLAIANSTAFTNNARFGQFIEIPSSLQGKTVTLSMNLNCSTSQNALLFAASYDGSTPITIKSSQITLSTTKTTYYITFIVPSTSYLYIGLALSCSASGYYGSTGAMTLQPCTLNAYWAKLELGSISTPFIPRLYGEELALCQRYYETISYSIVFPTTAVGQVVRQMAYLKVIKRTSPTLTLNSGYLNAFGTPTVTANSNIAIQVQATSTASGTGSEFSGTIACDAEIY